MMKKNINTKFIKEKTFMGLSFEILSGLRVDL
jgi:hypothetical protein